MALRRGDIYWVDLDPTKGHEIRKTRPTVIVSNDVSNEYSGIVTVIPLTSKVQNKKVYPFEVLVPEGVANFPSDSKAGANQIRTVDKLRLRGFVGRLPDRWMAQVDRAIKIHLALRD
ncbi:MAG: type II toxin-antitoxin system PemK/MazF family toxin [SAR324 cluster bacterium]|nr:type II toxin-antitoxin system PemK/MazF family toxin [SAR324 cluster bacterium]